MSGVNKVILLGRVGKDPEVKHMENGNIVASFSIATSEKYKDKSGEVKETTEWHNCVFWGKHADIVEKYVKKGDMLYVDGKLKTRSWEKDGVTKYVTEVIGNSIQMVGGKSGQSTTETSDDMPF